jgi:nucleoside-diphosphate-sugar epimerase
MNNILITGAAGFIGFHLAKLHLEKGDKVFILDNFFKTKSKDKEFINFIKKKNVFFYKVDLAEKINLKKFNVKNFQTVYHLAAINGTSLFYKIPYKIFTSNIKMTMNLLDWLKDKKIKNLIYSSSSEVYSQSYFLNLIKIPTDENALITFKQPIGDRMSYGLSKFFGEFLISSFIKNNKINGCTIRFHNIYGARMGNKHVIPELINRIKKSKKELKIYGGKQTRSFCYVDDAIRYLYLLSNKKKYKFNLYHIGNSKIEIKILNLVKKLLNLMNKKLKIKDYGEPAESVARRCPNTNRIIKETKYKPKTKLNEGLLKTMKWYLNVK